MAEHPLSPEEVRIIRDAVLEGMHREQSGRSPVKATTVVSVSHKEVEEIAEEVADRVVRKVLSSIGLDMDNPAETTVMIMSIRNLQKGVKTFVIGIFMAIATGIGGLIVAFFQTGHK